MALIRAVLAIAGRPVLVRALSTFVAVGLPSAVVFSPQGLDARDLVRAMHETPLLRAAVWVGWVALSAHATNAAFVAPGWAALRAHRPRRAPLVTSLLFLASFAQLPWAVLWFRGSGPLGALGAVTLAVATASSAFALTRRRTTRALLVLATAAFAAFAELPVAGLVLAPVAVDAAWRVAFEHRTDARVWTRPASPPAIALATVHLLRLGRAERLRLTLAAMIGGIGTAGLFSLRSEPTGRPLARALAIMAAPLVLGSALFVAPLVDCERGMIARLRSLRVRRSAIVAAFLLALAAPTSAFAATSGVCAGIASDVSAASLGGALGAWAVVSSGVVGAWGRIHDRTAKRSPVLFAGGVAAIAVAAVTLAMELS